MEEEIKKIERVFRALGFEKRLRILYLVMCKPDKTVSEICDCLRLPFQTTSRNLIVLADAGLIKGKQVNRYITYRANADGLFGSNLFLLSMVKKAYEAEEEDFRGNEDKKPGIWLGNYKLLKDYINV